MDNQKHRDTLSEGALCEKWPLVSRSTRPASAEARAALRSRLVTVLDRVFTCVVLHYACRSVVSVVVRIGTRAKRLLVGAAPGLRESAGGTSLQMVSRRSADRLVPFYLKECIGGGVCTPPRPLYTYIYQHAHVVTALRKRSQQQDSAGDPRLTVTRSHKF